MSEIGWELIVFDASGSESGSGSSGWVAVAVAIRQWQGVAGWMGGSGC
jgi:hypothetical protein